MGVEGMVWVGVEGGEVASADYNLAFSHCLEWQEIQPATLLLANFTDHLCKTQICKYKYNKLNGNLSLLMGSCLMNSFQLSRRREMQQKMKLQQTRGACLRWWSLEQSLCMGRRLLQFMADCIPTCWRGESYGPENSRFGDKKQLLLPVSNLVKNH